MVICVLRAGTLRSHLIDEGRLKSKTKQHHLTCHTRHQQEEIRGSEHAHVHVHVHTYYLPTTVHAELKCQMCRRS